MDANSLTDISSEILKKRIVVSWEGGSLLDLFKKISAENGLEFSYANGKIKGQQMRGFPATTGSVSSLLSSILDTTLFNYVMVGHIIAITKNEDQRKMATNDTVRQNKSYNRPRIYVPGSFKKASAYELKILKEIYGEEIKRVARLKRNDRKEQDSTSRQKKSIQKLRVVHRTQVNNAFWCKLSVGPSYNKLLFHDNVNGAWTTETKWKTTMGNSTYGEATAGVKWKGWLFSLGLGHTQFKVHNSWQETIRKGPPDFPPPPKFETIGYEVSETYQAFLIPFSVGYMYEWRKIVGAIGLGYTLSSTKADPRSKGVLQKYFAENYKGLYEETYYPSSSYVSGRLSLGYHVLRPLTVGAEWEYLYAVRPFYQNSFYELKKNSTCLKVSLWIWVGRF